MAARKLVRDGGVGSKRGFWSVERVVDVQQVPAAERKSMHGPAPKRAKLRWKGEHAALGRWVDAWVPWAYMNAELRKEAWEVWRARLQREREAAAAAAAAARLASGVRAREEGEEGRRRRSPRFV